MSEECCGSWLDGVSVILVEPEHPANIAATARVMAVNGLSDLRIVNPSMSGGQPSPQRWLAWGAEEILDKARRFSDLSEAIAHARYVIGATRRERKRKLASLTPREAAGSIKSEAGGGPVALVFGPERTGLHGAHLEFCHATTTIPQRTNHPSLNLSHAVAVYAYELTLLSWEPPPEPEKVPASAASLQALRLHLSRVLGKLGPAPERFARDLFTLWMRSRPTDGELRLLHRLLQMIGSRLTPVKGEYKYEHERTRPMRHDDPDG